MDAPKSSNIFLVMLVLQSMALTFSFATVFKAVCNKQLAVLPCSVQDPAGKDVIWKYQETNATNWNTIWDTSENEGNRNVPAKFNNVEVTVRNGSLTISPFSPRLSGVYSCKWDNEGQLVRDLYTVVAVSCETTVCEGDNAIIPCETLKIFDRRNVKEIRWKKGKENLVSSGHDMSTPYENSDYRGIGQTQGALTIKSVSKDWNGQRLTCVVHEGNGSTPKRYSVTLKIETCQKMIRVCQGKSIDLDCPYYQWMIDAGTEYTRFEWYRNATKMPQGTMITLVSLRLFDSGLYTCKVFNQELLVAEHSVTLNVTNCSPPGPRNISKREKNRREPKPTEAGEADGYGDEDKDKDSPPTEKIRDVVLVCLFVVFCLPIILYCMVKKRRSADQHQQASPGVRREKSVLGWAAMKPTEV